MLKKNFFFKKKTAESNDDKSMLMGKKKKMCNDVTYKNNSIMEGSIRAIKEQSSGVLSKLS